MKRLYLVTVSAQRRQSPTVTVWASTAMTEASITADPRVRAEVMAACYQHLSPAEYYGHTITNWLDITDTAVRFVATEVAQRAARPWLEEPAP